jgi:hypothetical protein
MKATVISVVPTEVVAVMPGLHPERYTIPAVAENDVEVLVVDDSHFYVYRLEGEQIRVQEPGESIARAIVNNYISSQLGCVPDGLPGLFYVEGAFTKEEALKKFNEKIAKARVIQNGWFASLIRMGDDAYNKTKQYASVSGLQRIACEFLKEEREWSRDIKAKISCPACGSTLPNAAVTVCAACRTIIKPKEHAEKFGALAGAK